MTCSDAGAPHFPYRWERQHDHPSACPGVALTLGPSLSVNPGSASTTSLPPCGTGWLVARSATHPLPSSCVSVGRPVIGRHEGPVEVKGALSLDPGRFFMCP